MIRRDQFSVRPELGAPKGVVGKCRENQQSPGPGRESVMMASSELAWSELEALRETISRSPIFLARLALAARLADWQRTRVSADVDDVILAWIGSHVPRRPLAELS
jgi:hypothetical protein